MAMKTKSLLLCLLFYALTASADDEQYLYYRDMVLPNYQSEREFFDLPNRYGVYDIHLSSESLGPLTFRIVTVDDDGDHEQVKRRSYAMGEHVLNWHIESQGDEDLAVEIANSNPLLAAQVTVIIVEREP